MAKVRNPDVAESDVPSRSEFTLLQGVVLGITFVIVITVIGFILSALATKQSSYQQLMIQISQSNAKIDLLTEEIKDLNIALGVKKTMTITPPTSIEIPKEFTIDP